VQRVLAHWPAGVLPFAADEVSFFGQADRRCRGDEA